MTSTIDTLLEYLPKILGGIKTENFTALKAALTIDSTAYMYGPTEDNSPTTSGTTPGTTLHLNVNFTIGNGTVLTLDSLKLYSNDGLVTGVELDQTAGTLNKNSTALNTNARLILLRG